MDVSADQPLQGFEYLAEDDKDDEEAAKAEDEAANQLHPVPNISHYLFHWFLS